MTNDSSLTATVPEGAAESVATAAAGVAGVHALGSMLERASDAVRERVGLATRAPGVKVDRARDGHVTAAVSIVVDYPHKLHEVSDAVREAARHALDGLAPGPVDVDVLVTGVWGPFDTDPVDEAEAAVDEAAAATADVADGVAAAAQEAADEVADAADAGDADTDAPRGEEGSPDAARAADAERRDAGADHAGADHAASTDAGERDAEELVADALEEIADSVARAADDVRDGTVDERG